MAVGTVTETAANARALDRAMAKKNRKAALQAYGSEGVYILYRTYTIATTSIDDAGDEVHLMSFPPNTRLLDLRLKITDMDSSTGLTFDIITDDGSTENKLISASTKAQAGGSDELDADLDPSYFDLSNKDLVFQCAAAASGTPAAGTLTMRVVVAVGEKYLATW